MISRRQFLKSAALVTAGVVLSPAATGTPSEAATLPLETGLGAPAVLRYRTLAQAAPLNPRTLTKYQDALPRPGVMPPVSPASPNDYQVGIFQTSQQLHSQLPNPTVVWGYGGSQATATYPGATFEVTRNVQVKVEWLNGLVDASGNHIPHPLAVDQTIHWANPLNAPMTTTTRYGGPVPITVHVHGGEQAAASDGHPDSWFTPGYAITGPGWQPGVYTYHNQQPPTTLWYHDHALGITRLNVYMGLAGFYLIRDPGNEPPDLPGGDYEIPLVVQDRMFDVNGQLLYPSTGINPTIHPFWVPEFFGDTILVNGKVWPFLEVEPRRYRFRLLNGSDARFYTLSLDSRQPIFQIGTDGGYLPAPVPLKELTIAPGERADVVIDFTGMAGATVTMTNSAKAPFPKGAPADPQTVGQIMQFRVALPLNPDVPNNPLPGTLVPVTPLGPATLTRPLTLNEVIGPAGPTGLFLNGTLWSAPITEQPALGSTEIWQVINLTADTHPIHLHLTQFQLLDRQRFQLNKYLKAFTAANPPLPVDTAVTIPDVTPYLQGAPMPPDANEAGWKDTVRMNPGEVTRIIVRFAPIGGGEYLFDAKAFPYYVWHCHILEHEDNEMMRPYQVV